MRPPPSLTSWQLDGEMRNGHTTREVLAYAAWCQDWADEQAALRSAPGWVISPRCEPRIVSRLRRWFGR
jgi:hypothetical protein